LRKEIESRKPIVLSINLVAPGGAQNVDDDDDDDDVTKTLAKKIKRMKDGWENVNTVANQKREELQKALVSSPVSKLCGGLS